ncbi:hypothetical protein ACOMHN_034723 [Nucella lapillus]
MTVSGLGKDGDMILSDRLKTGKGGERCTVRPGKMAAGKGRQLSLIVDRRPEVVVIAGRKLWVVGITTRLALGSRDQYPLQQIRVFGS